MDIAAHQPILRTPLIEIAMPNRPYRVALNGYGRIGRCVLRALHERGADARLQIVALNDLADPHRLIIDAKLDRAILLEQVAKVVRAVELDRHRRRLHLR